jgi:hypothetical protein
MRGILGGSPDACRVPALTPDLGLSMHAMHVSFPPSTWSAGPPHAGVGHQLADHEVRRHRLPAADLPHHVHVAGPAGAGRVLLWRRVPFAHRARALARAGVLTVFNMLFWHTLAILAIQSLSSGRAAILGYTMPVFSAVMGSMWFGQRLPPGPGAAWRRPRWAWCCCCGTNHRAVGQAPQGVAMMLVAAATWAVGTQMMRRTTLPHPTLAISFWMTVLTTLWMSLLAWCSSAAPGCAPARGLGRHRLQRARRVRLCPGGLADAGARPAADRVHPVGDVHPGAGRVQRRLVAGRGAALAGLGRRGAGDACWPSPRCCGRPATTARRPLRRLRDRGPWPGTGRPRPWPCRSGCAAGRPGGRSRSPAHPGSGAPGRAAPMGSVVLQQGLHRKAPHGQDEPSADQRHLARQERLALATSSAAGCGWPAGGT